MATMIIMPRQGQSVESCLITGWEKAVGDTVHEGDTLFTYETDKACFEETAKVSGTLLAILHEEQDDVPCLANVAIIGEPGEDISALLTESKGRHSADSAQATQKVSVAAPLPTERPANATEASAISPRARTASQRLHVNVSAVTPSGPHGRIIERDIICAGNNALCEKDDPVQHASVTVPTDSSVETKPDYHDEKVSRMRQLIAHSMTESLSNMAQLTHHSSFDATAMIEYRKVLKASENEAIARITYNDILLFAVSRILKNHPLLNAHWLDGQNAIRIFHHVHLGMAVDTPRGLLVVTIRNADTKSLLEISKEAKALAAEAQNGSINPDKLAGATFTLSNLGALGIEMFTPIINPPQTGILGVDCLIDRVRSSNGEIEIYPAMGISLTYDHRALDGAPASKFLRDLKNAMEHITALLAE